MIYFDRKTLAILKYIRRRNKRGVTWGELQRKFGEDTANTFLLANFSKELYTCTQNQNGKWVDDDFKIVDNEYRSFTTPKANQLIERECFDFWKWIIPTPYTYFCCRIGYKCT